MSKSLCVILQCFIGFSRVTSAQDVAFRTWFDLPETVLAGHTIQVWLWASFEVDNVPAADGWFNGLYGSIEVSGDLAAFSSISEVQDGLSVWLSPGTPDGPWLRDVFVIQVYGWPGIEFDDRNPLPVLMFEVATTPETTGNLQVDLRPPSDRTSPLLTWRDDDGIDWVDSDGPGVGLTASSGLVRVIPTPSCVGLLASAALAARRRRTRP
ncbi:MAG: hypothetical protein Kow0022_12380 [Phycisphaerales bacterium]